MTRRKTDGERIADGVFWNLFGFASQREEKKRLSDSIDRLLRKRMAEAWDEGHDWGAVWALPKANPYRGRKRK